METKYWVAIIIVVILVAIYWFWTGLARGIRNNNPTNVTGTGWNGQTGSDGSFAVFDNITDGYRAASININSYINNDGVTTLNQLGARWATISATLYGTALAAQLGVGADDTYDFADNMAPLLAAITVNENGFCPYSQAQIQAGVNAAS